MNYDTISSRRSVMRPLARHWGALLALALFLSVGLAALDDYGVEVDELAQRQNVEANLEYLASGDLPAFLVALGHNHNKFYGMTFEAVLLVPERIFGIEDFRGILLNRRILGHLFYLAGGLFAYLLAFRLFGGRLIALFAMFLFLLHPRLYAHSYFSSTDIPFLAMFAVALFLTHRAFRRDSVAAFALLGLAVGLLVNLRVMGLILAAAVPALRALDFALAQGWAERKRVLLTTSAFALAGALTGYALLPYLWGDPLARAVEWWTTLSNHPHIASELFRGAVRRSVDLPAEYLPVWFSITGPPFALGLGLIGAAAVAAGCIRSPRRALRSARLRFALLLAGCFALPILAVMLPGGNIYGGWRHMHFLWAPFALLAALGLQWLASAPGSRRLQAAAYGAAGAGLAGVVVAMTLIHPNQQEHFNFFVDRISPERLRSQYQLHFWWPLARQGFEEIARRSPPGQAEPPYLAGSNIGSFLANALTAPDAERERLLYPSRENNNPSGLVANALILPESARERLASAPPFDTVPVGPGAWSRSARELHRVKVYGNTIWSAESRDDLRQVHQAVRGRDPLIDAGFEVHLIDGALALAMEPCAPSFIEKARVTIRAFPADTGDLPPWRQGKTSEPRNFYLHNYGAFFEGKCVASLPLPAYRLADFTLDWSPGLLGEAEARARARAARDDGRLLSPAASPAAYDVYLTNGKLSYISDSCDPLATEHPFYLNVYPERIADLPEERQALGYEHYDFEFIRAGAFADGGCAAFFPLPDYLIAGVQTGQSREDGGGDLWRAEFLTDPERRWAEAVAGASQEPAARGVFDVHVADGALVYVKEPCAQTDTEARFFLHITPERAADLPESRRASGFDNLDFDFFLNGALFDGKCAVRAALPAYPVASVRTGQFAGGREIWSASFSEGDGLAPRFAVAGRELAGADCCDGIFREGDAGRALAVKRDAP